MPGEGPPPAPDHVRFGPGEQHLPDLTVLGSIAPILIDGRTRTLTLAEQEESTAAAPPMFLRRAIEGEISFVSGLLRLHEIDTLLVRPAAVRALPVPFDAAHGAGRVGIARVPHAGRALIL